MHPARVTDQLAALRKRWRALDPADAPACRDLAARIGCAHPTQERLGAILDACDLLWLCWQQDMRQAHADRNRLTVLLREAEAPLTVIDGAVLVRWMRAAVQSWSRQRLAALEKPLGLGPETAQSSPNDLPVHHSRS